MKRVITIIMVFAVFVTLVSCAKKPKSESAEVIVFAAASMTETLTELAELYKEEAPEVTLIFNFDSSGTLVSQIKEGADCDIFISAAQKQMNEIDKAHSADSQDLVDSTTRFDLVINRVVLIAAGSNEYDLSAFEDVVNAETIAVGNSDVPVGQYAEEIFTNMGLWDTLQSKLTFGSNVKEVLSWVSEGAADCGVVYATDASSAGLAVVAYAPDGSLRTPVVYPAAMLKQSENAKAAQAFLEFLKTDAATEVFAKAGFSR